MEVMTSSFPSGNPTRTQLDDIIFYSGPPSKKSYASAPADGDVWPDIDEILAEAAQQHWGTSIERLDLQAGFDVTVKGEPRSNGLYSGPPANALDSRHTKCN